MANLYPTKKDRDGFFDFLPSWFDEWGHNFFRNTGIQPFAADVQEKSNAYEVKVDLPGFSRDNIHLDFDQGVLTIDATREQETNEKAEDGSFIRKERASGSYTRRFMLDGIKEDEIKASFKDGVLQVTLPKREEAQKPSKSISID
ncbi:MULTISPECIES: Hsp20/alpha crystallin family protein [unclassified Sporolactobacillus]|uniref:Hsp20/alpha crystallin family protein n=1 Tax=unclassified Sporolactobacillus TaxID=2628533 RepID=UPI002368F01A|nr:Hsp20/alpha crystallin family protein [Sporolactobacillus sp. CQH2019]MDD9148536.1 Hsp20/alpha crystallin family protein [Sporolactobacillus sp. CQH2019]